MPGTAMAADTGRQMSPCVSVPIIDHQKAHWLSIVRAMNWSLREYNLHAPERAWH